MCTTTSACGHGFHNSRPSTRHISAGGRPPPVCFPSASLSTSPGRASPPTALRPLLRAVSPVPLTKTNRMSNTEDSSLYWSFPEASCFVLPVRATRGDNDHVVGSRSFFSWADCDTLDDAAVPLEAAARRKAARRAGGSWRSDHACSTRWGECERGRWGRGRCRRR